MHRVSTMSLRVSSLLALLLAAALASSAQAVKGEWTLGRSFDPGKVRLSLETSWNGENHYSSSSDWSLSDLQGLDSSASRHDVRFTIARDAGRFSLDGFFQDGEGAGLFTFTPNSQYASQMAAAGFPGIAGDRQFALALHDISLDFARQMKSLNIEGLDTEKLIAFRIHGVTPEFTHAIRDAGVMPVDAEKLIAFRIHGVSPEFVKDLRDAGVDITDSEKLVAFRIHGVSPEFVRDLQKLGYSHPDPEQLIALRIHGVTPEYIEALRSHGLHDLTLQQLVRLRIQGIN
jgi:hypothetical protein